MVPSDGPYERLYGRSVRTFHTDGRYGQIVRAVCTDGRYGRTVRTVCTDGPYGWSARTVGTDGPRYVQSVRTVCMDGPYGRSVRTVRTDRPFFFVFSMILGGSDLKMLIFHLLFNGFWVVFCRARSSGSDPGHPPHAPGGDSVILFTT